MSTNNLRSGRQIRNRHLKVRLDGPHDPHDPPPAAAVSPEALRRQRPTAIRPALTLNPWAAEREAEALKAYRLVDPVILVRAPVEAGADGAVVVYEAGQHRADPVWAVSVAAAAVPEVRELADDLYAAVYDRAFLPHPWPVLLIGADGDGREVGAVGPLAARRGTVVRWCRVVARALVAAAEDAGAARAA